jgi:hypothetical protein
LELRKDDVATVAGPPSLPFYSKASYLLLLTFSLIADNLIRLRDIAGALPESTSIIDQPSVAVVPGSRRRRWGHRRDLRWDTKIVTCFAKPETAKNNADVHAPPCLNRHRRPRDHGRPRSVTVSHYSSHPA